MTPERAKQLSIHSFRVWLACALLAAGATPEQIMLMLRWSSEAARKLYARLGERVQVSLLNAAADVSLDSVRSHTLFASEGAHAGLPVEGTAGAAQAGSGPAAAGAAHSGQAPTCTQKEAAEAVEQALRLVNAAHAWRGVLPNVDALPCAIDDDNEHRRLREALPSLRAEAAAADEAIRGDGGKSDASDGDM